MMILAGDIGGTSTRLGLFEAAGPRPRAVATRVFGTLDFATLPAMVTAFLNGSRGDGRIDRACFGVAGPVLGESAELTNVPWRVEAQAVATAFDIGQVRLLNDLQAMAYSVPVLEPDELQTLQAGMPDPQGNIGLIAAGTGLGIALLHRVEGRLIPAPSEGGHADFAARTDRDVVLLRDLTARYGRAEVEQVISGPGLVNVHRVLHSGPCGGGVNPDAPDAPAAISTAALEGRCRQCAEALDMFVEAYGAEAGNTALRGVTTGGLYVGGGIAPKILPAMTSGTFMRAFRAKAPFEDLLARVPVRIILNSEAGLVGAAVCAQRA